MDPWSSSASQILAVGRRDRNSCTGAGFTMLGGSGPVIDHADQGGLLLERGFVLVEVMSMKLFQ